MYVNYPDRPCSSRRRPKEPNREGLPPKVLNSVGWTKPNYIGYQFADVVEQTGVIPSQWTKKDIIVAVILVTQLNSESVLSHLLMFTAKQPRLAATGIAA